MAYHPTISHLRFPRLFLELARHDNEIARLKAQLAEMETNSAIMQEFRDECQSVLASVRRLPSEILTQILELCMTHVFGTPEFEEDHYNKPTYHI